VRAWENGKPSGSTRGPLTDQGTPSAAPRFAEVEVILIVTMFMARYKVEVKEEPQFANETFEERKARVTAWSPILTTT